MQGVHTKNFPQKCVWCPDSPPNCHNLICLGEMVRQICANNPAKINKAQPKNISKYLISI